MRLVSWNVNGWRAIWRKGLRDWVAATRPDLLCIQESKTGPDRLPATETVLAGYDGFWAVAERPGYSGVTTFSKAPCR